LQIYHGCWMCEALIRLICGNRGFKMNTNFCWQLCFNSSMNFRQSSSTYGDPFHLVLGFGRCSSQLMMSSHDLCMLSYPWKLLLWICLINWLFCLQMLQLTRHQLSVPIENLTSLPFGSNFT